MPHGPFTRITSGRKIVPEMWNALQRALENTYTRGEVADAVQDAIADDPTIIGVAEAAVDAAVPAAAETAVDAEIAGRDLVESTDDRLPESGASDDEAAYAVTDEAGNPSWLAADSTGDPTTAARDRLQASLHTPATAPYVGDYAYTVTDENGNPSDLTLTRAGRLAPFVVQRLGVPVGTEFDAATKSDLANVVCWGDSITHGYTSGESWPERLATLTGKTVEKRGYSGYWAAPIALQQGGLTVAITMDGGVIPASGSATFTYVASVVPAALVGSYSTPGTLAGVPGSISLDASTTGSGTGTFTRTSAGDETPVPAGTVFVSQYANSYRDHLALLWAGRNDTSGADPVRQVLDATQAMIDHFTPQVTRFLVASVLTRSTEAPGDAGYDAALAINAALAATYPLQFVDMWQLIIDRGLDMAGITPTADDLTALAVPTVPPSLLSDDLHPNETCRTLVIAPLWQEALKARGWA